MTSADRIAEFVQRAMDEARAEAEADAAGWKKGVEDANRISQRFEEALRKSEAHRAMMTKAAQDLHLVYCGRGACDGKCYIECLCDLCQQLADAAWEVLGLNRPGRSGEGA